MQEKIDLKAFGSKSKKEQEPWWKRRIRKLINKVRKHIKILEHHQRGEARRKEKYYELKRKCNKEKRNQNSDRTAETATPCKNSKAEEI